ncbi:hypothetical protein PT974_09512 [Cladobotryum mycophilum]|uniref:Uncharacterized protein n=1 Tax=Cladobotryum mycophilum TaxID=491253 RepID=A0ABR0SGW5_9HYPO
MEHGPENFTAPTSQGIGLQFLNENWNGSISNGAPFTIRWNQSFRGDAFWPQLGLFKIGYPQDGLIAYELVSNLTASMNNDNASCVWTPGDLEDDLYTLFLSSARDSHSNWTISPPWRLKAPPRYPFHLAAPIVIPIVGLLLIYALSLTTCYIYRRRRRAKRQRDGPDDDDTTPLRDTERHPSVDTIITVETLEDSNRAKKPKIWLMTDPSSVPILLMPTTPSSERHLLSPTSPLSEPSFMSPTSPYSESASITPFSTISDQTFIAPISPLDRRVAQADKDRRRVRVVIPTEERKIDKGKQPLMRLYE